MEAINRESYADAKERLERLAADATPEQLSAVADDVLAVAGLLSREPRLRRALADSSRPTDARVDLARSLFDGKIGAEALALVVDLASGRWALPSQLLTATELLGVEVVLAAAERAGELIDVEDELFRFGQIVSGDSQLGGVLGDSTADPERRATLLESLLDGKAKPTTVRLAGLALRGFGGRSFVGGLSRLVELAAQRRNAAVAYVIAAVAPTDAEEQELVARLSRMYGRDISLKVEVKPEIIGGMSVRVGSDLYDGTVSRRLQEARAALAK
jgi:F-type H+-transporting ATPase subunit delta